MCCRHCKYLWEFVDVIFYLNFPHSPTKSSQLDLLRLTEKNCGFLELPRSKHFRSQLLLLDNNNPLQTPESRLRRITTLPLYVQLFVYTVILWFLGVLFHCTGLQLCKCSFVQVCLSIATLDTENETETIKTNNSEVLLQSQRNTGRKQHEVNLLNSSGQ